MYILYKCTYTHAYIRRRVVTIGRQRSGVTEIKLIKRFESNRYRKGQTHVVIYTTVKFLLARIERAYETGYMCVKRITCGGMGGIQCLGDEPTVHDFAKELNFLFGVG